MTASVPENPCWTIWCDDRSNASVGRRRKTHTLDVAACRDHGTRKAQLQRARACDAAAGGAPRAGPGISAATSDKRIGGDGTRGRRRTDHVRWKVSRRHRASSLARAGGRAHRATGYLASFAGARRCRPRRRAASECCPGVGEHALMCSHSTRASEGVSAVGSATPPARRPGHGGAQREPGDQVVDRRRLVR